MPPTTHTSKCLSGRPVATLKLVKQFSCLKVHPPTDNTTSLLQLYLPRGHLKISLWLAWITTCFLALFADFSVLFCDISPLSINPWMPDHLYLACSYASFTDGWLDNWVEDWRSFSETWHFIKAKFLQEKIFKATSLKIIYRSYSEDSPSNKNPSNFWNAVPWCKNVNADVSYLVSLYFLCFFFFSPKLFRSADMFPVLGAAWVWLVRWPQQHREGALHGRLLSGPDEETGKAGPGSPGPSPAPRYESGAGQLPQGKGLWLGLHSVPW